MTKALQRPRNALRRGLDDLREALCRHGFQVLLQVQQLAGGQVLRQCLQHHGPQGLRDPPQRLPTCAHEAESRAQAGALGHRSHLEFLLLPCGGSREADALPAASECHSGQMASVRDDFKATDHRKGLPRANSDLIPG